MNTDYILFNLREALEELSRTISEIENGERAAVDEAYLRDALAHVYHHINFAWNSRNAEQARIDQLDDLDFREWRQFPADILL